MNTMNRYSAENTSAGLHIQLNNYDVVLMSSTDGEARFAPGNYVGNQRFRVLLSLHRLRYLQAKMFGEECECISIAQEVLDTVSGKCVPKGRFFIRDCDDSWQQWDCNSPLMITLIRNALESEPVEDSLVDRAPKRLCQNSSRSELSHKVNSKGLRSAQQEFVESPNPFDVVFEANGLGLSQDGQFTGNNRLKVMLDIRRNSNQASTQKGKQTIADEVVSSIIDDADGLFLQADKQSGKYKVLSRTAAMACIINALDTSADVGKKKVKSSEVKKLAPFETIINAAISRQAARQSRYNRAA